MTYKFYRFSGYYCLLNEFGKKSHHYISSLHIGESMEEALDQFNAEIKELGKRLGDSAFIDSVNVREAVFPGYEVAIRKSEPQEITNKIRSLQENLVNYQDVVIVAFLEEGLSLQEMVQVDISDVDMDKKAIYLKDRVIQVSENTLSITRNAFHQESYHPKNGESDSILKLKSGTSVIRGVKSEKPTVDLVRNRIKTIEERLGIDLKSYL